MLDGAVRLEYAPWARRGLSCEGCTATSAKAREEEVVQGSEYERDVPAPSNALDQSKHEAGPAAELETRQRNRKCVVTDR